MGGFVCRDGGGEERMTLEEGGGGMSDSLTELGERLFILEGCSNVCFTRKGGKGGGASVFKTVVDICTKFTDKYSLPFPISTRFSLLFFLGSGTRTVI